jgi:hypothetical protein
LADAGKLREAARCFSDAACGSASPDILKDIRERLKKNEMLFYEFYSHVDTKSDDATLERPVYYNPSAAEDATIQKILADIRRDGVAIWRGLFSDPAILEECRAISEEMLSVHERHFENVPASVDMLSGLGDPFVYVGNPERREGIRRVQFYHTGLHSPYRALDTMLYSPLLQEITARYFKAEVVTDYFEVEIVKNAPVIQQVWHMDCIFDYFKIMIPLCDVDLDSGPLCYKMGSHNHQNPENSLVSFAHGVFCDGDKKNKPLPHDVEAMPGAITYGSGKAGDCIFFDPSGFHFGEMPASGKERLNILVSLSARTLKNAAIGCINVKSIADTEQSNGRE